MTLQYACADVDALAGALALGAWTLTSCAPRASTWRPAPSRTPSCGR